MEVVVEVVVVAAVEVVVAAVEMVVGAVKVVLLFLKVPTINTSVGAKGAHLSNVAFSLHRVSFRHLLSRSFRAYDKLKKV